MSFENTGYEICGTLARVETTGYCTDIFFEAAIRFIEKNREQGPAPFFVYLPTNAPQTPLEVAAKYSDRYQVMGLNEATTKVYGMVTNIDVSSETFSTKNG